MWLGGRVLVWHEQSHRFGPQCSRGRRKDGRERGRKRREKKEKD